jgi:hypothetical protein
LSRLRSATSRADQLEILFPERHEYFSFFDFDELKVDGGASHVVKFLKAFASARTPLRLVAVFDNDTAGLRALNDAQKSRLPSTMATLRLPDIEIGRAYGCTLMQMGRWFGYRKGYQDLVRLFIGTSEVINKRGETINHYEAFGAICRDEEAFGRELKRYASLTEPGGRPTCGRSSAALADRRHFSRTFKMSNYISRHIELA